MNRARLLFLSLLLATQAACASLNGEVPFRYTPSLPTAQPVPLTAGMAIFEDQRPEDQRKKMKSIADVDEKVTAKFLDDVRTSGVFTQVNFPPTGQEDLQLRPRITSFVWRAKPSPILYIPIVQLSMYFGVPMYTIEATAAFEVDAVDASGVIKTYAGEFTQVTKQSLYNSTAGEMGAELADAFRAASKQIKDEMMRDSVGVLKR